jgi:hypothetical protein
MARNHLLVKKAAEITLVMLVFLSPGLNRSIFGLELEGKVAQVAGLDVKIELLSRARPNAGDQAEIRFSLPEGDTVSIGTWRIFEVRERHVLASVVSNTGRPQIGQSVVIYSNSPVPIMPKSSAARLEEVQTTRAIQPKLFTPPAVEASVEASAPPETITLPDSPKQSAETAVPVKTVAKTIALRPKLPAELRSYMNMLRSVDSKIQRNAAKKVYKTKWAQHSEILRIAHQELLKGYKVGVNDSYHVDGMSWLCTLLAVSGKEQYRKTLQVVAERSPSKKIRKYALKGLKKLGSR